ncbi:hypothetical protein FIBSPDRAFT_864459 [Athelia psychrophila]|uniref:Uncharacterized protein n=1 Tax=Athelia psychrophila TaxID=1759441 RepID=A0A166GH96_9AGAM|nr:hypothetical protein FIBSPDRAFT_864459 [Fibularhizoctonia sp. CBS 109695]
MMLVPVVCRAQDLAHCWVIKTKCYENETNTPPCAADMSACLVSRYPGDYPMIVQHDKVIDMLVMQFSTPSRFTLLA